MSKKDIEDLPPTEHKIIRGNLSPEKFSGSVRVKFTSISLTCCTSISVKTLNLSYSWQIKNENCLCLTIKKIFKIMKHFENLD